MIASIIFAAFAGWLASDMWDRWKPGFLIVLVLYGVGLADINRHPTCPPPIEMPASD